MSNLSELSEEKIKENLLRRLTNSALSDLRSKEITTGPAAKEKPDRNTERFNEKIIKLKKMLIQENEAPKVGDDWKTLTKKLKSLMV